MQLDEYRKLAETEDRMWYFHALHQRVLLPLRPWRGKPASVLDAGCGTGGLIRCLSSQEPLWTLTGLDFSPIACSLARERTSARIVEGSITEMPFPPCSFDIVICADVLSQIKGGSLALHEIARVLRPGGVMVINVAAYRWMWSYHDEQVETKHRYRRSELTRMARSCGLRPLEASYVNTIIFPLIIARRKILPPKAATSDVMVYSPLVETTFAFMAKIEHTWLRLGLSFPTGCSVFLAASKS
ncbi:class I SAM-dependent methyltransferase [Cyanobium gracile]|uniref:Methylase involved in ubiquinone/menaquinone biosynthesis n=1 Tax=Cyanobium gracile (strain ATCC 27147 / PCC 6307) TaxID=292564 RepID=K9PA97_CYAGP|nr:class I SAM-dependent methyltransferase [Cyanobium gracile]AFY30302.1 methylase involved in ubiquinone/menaquinone biosynthesis [Cyanobium gracile PCC 6307]